MKVIVAFMAGAACGWVARSAVDSSRALLVGLLSDSMGLVDRVKRLFAIEREQLEDLLAESKSRYEARAGRGEAVASGEASASVQVGQEEEAA